MLGGLSPAGVNVDLLAVVEARVVVRVSGRVGDSEVRAGWPPTRRRPLILAVPIRKFYLFSKRLRAGKEPASGDDSEGREPSGKILPGRP